MFAAVKLVICTEDWRLAKPGVVSGFQSLRCDDVDGSEVYRIGSNCEQAKRLFGLECSNTLQARFGILSNKAAMENCLARVFFSFSKFEGSPVLKDNQSNSEWDVNSAEGRLQFLRYAT